jgi:predicted  nucleic acid-binding Zn-ribbon protein
MSDQEVVDTASQPFGSLSKKKWIVVGVVLLLILISSAGLLDAPSNDYVDSALVRSTVAYAAARGLNGVVSVLQSTTFSISMFGGMSITGGEILDPVNDLVEQYSTLMKFSIGSLVVQKILLEIVSHGFFKFITAISGLLLIGSLLSKGSPNLLFLIRAFVFVLFLRFILVMVVMLNGVVSYYFIQEKTDSDVATLNVIAADFEDNVQMNEDQQSTIGVATSTLSDLQDRRDDLNEQIEDQQPELNEIAERLEAAEAVLSGLRANQGIVERFTSSTPEIDEALQQIERVEIELESMEADIAPLRNELDDVEDQIVWNENVIAGRPNTIGERVGQQWDSMVSIADITSLKERLEQSSMQIITVMSLFMFETLILPLVFLFLLSKGLSAIWGIDMRKWLPEKTNLQTSLAAK